MMVVLLSITVIFYIYDAYPSGADITDPLLKTTTTTMPPTTATKDPKDPSFLLSSSSATSPSVDQPLESLFSFSVQTIMLVLALGFYTAVEVGKNSWFCQSVLPPVFVALQVLVFPVTDWKPEAPMNLIFPIRMVDSMIVYLFTGFPVPVISLIASLTFAPIIVVAILSGKDSLHVTADLALLFSAQVCGVLLYSRCYVLAMDLLYAEVYTFQAVRNLPYIHELELQSISALELRYNRTIQQHTQQHLSRSGRSIGHVHFQEPEELSRQSSNGSFSSESHRDSNLERKDEKKKRSVPPLPIHALRMRQSTLLSGHSECHAKSSSREDYPNSDPINSKRRSRTTPRVSEASHIVDLGSAGARKTPKNLIDLQSTVAQPVTSFEAYIRKIPNMRLPNLSPRFPVGLKGEGFQFTRPREAFEFRENMPPPNTTRASWDSVDFRRSWSLTEAEAKAVAIHRSTRRLSHSSNAALLSTGRLPLSDRPTANRIEFMRGGSGDGQYIYNRQNSDNDRVTPLHIQTAHRRASAAAVGATVAQSMLADDSHRKSLRTVSNSQSMIDNRNLVENVSYAPWTIPKRLDFRRSITSSTSSLSNTDDVKPEGIKSRRSPDSTLVEPSRTLNISVDHKSSPPSPRGLKRFDTKKTLGFEHFDEVEGKLVTATIPDPDLVIAPAPVVAPVPPLESMRSRKVRFSSHLRSKSRRSLSSASFSAVSGSQSFISWMRSEALLESDYVDDLSTQQDTGRRFDSSGSIRTPIPLTRTKKGPIRRSAPVASLRPSVPRFLNDDSELSTESAIGPRCIPESNQETVYGQVRRHFARMLVSQVRTDIRFHRRSFTLGTPQANSEWRLMLWAFRQYLNGDDVMMSTREVCYGLKGWLPFQQNPLVTTPQHECASTTDSHNDDSNYFSRGDSLTDDTTVIDNYFGYCEGDSRPRETAFSSRFSSGSPTPAPSESSGVLGPSFSSWNHLGTLPASESRKNSRKILGGPVPKWNPSSAVDSDAASPEDLLSRWKSKPQTIRDSTKDPPDSTSVPKYQRRKARFMSAPERISPRRDTEHSDARRSLTRTGSLRLSNEKRTESAYGGDLSSSPGPRYFRGTMKM